MSNSMAIAAVTATLQRLLSRKITATSDIDPNTDPELTDTTVTTRPPDQARDGNNTANQLNLFLYKTEPNPAWRNMNIPGKVKPGESQLPPLPLDLYYLITAYGRNNDDVFSHRLLGRAMSILHDYAVLDREMIKSALDGNDLHDQIERVRLTPQPLSVDEISKLWTVFQTQYRISAAYQVSVVLLESTQPVVGPLPVLRRGPEDRGVLSQPDLIPPLPTLTHIELPNGQPGLRVSDSLTVHGHHLDGDSVSARLAHRRLETPLDVLPEPGNTSTNLTLRLSNTLDAADVYPPGMYGLAVAVTKTEGQVPVIRMSNELAFPLVPRITVNSISNQTLILECTPKVWPAQQVSVFLGSKEIPAPSRSDKAALLTFDVSDIPAGQYLVRLRVDGMDSLPIADYEALPFTFDEQQMVTIP